MLGGHWSAYFAVVLGTIRKEIRGTAQDYFPDYCICIPDQSKKEGGEGRGGEGEPPKRTQTQNVPRTTD